jgi:bifunctional non-homologous end joining protein LigD
LWDRGTFELLGDATGLEQIARGDLKFHLNGEKLNGDFALVHMRGRGKGNEWLLIKKRDAFASEGWDVEEHAYSVLSGRTQEEIARNLPVRKTKRKTAGAADRVWESDRPKKAAAGVTTADTGAAAAPGAAKKTGARTKKAPSAAAVSTPRKKKRTSTSGA